MHDEDRKEASKDDAQAAIRLGRRRVSMNYVSNSTWRDVIVDVIHQRIDNISNSAVQCSADDDQHFTTHTSIHAGTSTRAQAELIR